MGVKKDIKIIMENSGYSYEEARRSLEKGTVTYEKEDLVSNADFYLRQMDLDEDDENDAKEIEAFREMIRTGKPMPDWGVVEFGEKQYFIQYCL